MLCKPLLLTNSPVLCLLMLNVLVQKPALICLPNPIYLVLHSTRRFPDCINFAPFHGRTSPGKSCF